MGSYQRFNPVQDTLSTVEVKPNYFVKPVFIKQNISSGKIDYNIIVISNNLATKMIAI